MFFKKKTVKKEVQEETNPLPELYDGMRIEVLTLENRLIFVAKLEVLERGAFQLWEEFGNNVPQVEYNTKIKLRGFRRDMQTFALYAMICGSGGDFWRVDRLENLQTTEKRGFFRQSTSIDASAMCANDIFDPERDMPEIGAKVVPCRIIDISGGGVLVRCKEVYRAEDWLLLTGVSPIPDEGELSFACQIRRVIKGKGYYDYGCQFGELTDKEQDRLLRIIMFLQRKNLQARRGGRDF